MKNLYKRNSAFQEKHSKFVFKENFTGFGEDDEDRNQVSLTENQENEVIMKEIYEVLEEPNIKGAIQSELEMSLGKNFLNELEALDLVSLGGTVPDNYREKIQDGFDEKIQNSFNILQKNRDEQHERVVADDELVFNPYVGLADYTKLGAKVMPDYRKKLKSELKSMQEFYDSGRLQIMKELGLESEYFSEESAQNYMDKMLKSNGIGGSSLSSLSYLNSLGAKAPENYYAEIQSNIEESLVHNKFYIAANYLLYNTESKIPEAYYDKIQSNFEEDLEGEFVTGFDRGVQIRLMAKLPYNLKMKDNFNKAVQECNWKNAAIWFDVLKRVLPDAKEIDNEPELKVEGAKTAVINSANDAINNK